ncbi:MAG TPA: hypothetical protein VKA86_06850 [Candidatus Krumholzibacteria bacterium]|nr:hypothetical protein [Candidatus Krumholzibacteria bacterium]
MATTVIISRDPELHAFAARSVPGDLTWVENCADLDSALSLAVTRVLVDLNVEWEEDLTGCIARCKERGVKSVVAFLHERKGDVAIRAHLAGADRVISQAQLEKEWEHLTSAESENRA